MDASATALAATPSPIKTFEEVVEVFSEVVSTTLRGRYFRRGVHVFVGVVEAPEEAALIPTTSTWGQIR